MTGQLGIEPNPDFQRFRDTLLLRHGWRRPPLFDFHINAPHKAAVLGRPVETPADDVAFFRAAGYDYVQATVHVPVTELADVLAQDRTQAASHSSDHGLIKSPEDFRARRWSWQVATEGDLSACQPALAWLRGQLAALPPTMKILLHNADVFTYAWELLGFSPFCLASLEQPEFVRELMQSLAAAQLNATRAAAALVGDQLGAVFYSDDIAYTEGLMLGPNFYREFLFPTIAEFAQIGQARGAPLIYHTDGRLYDVFDDLARIGVRAIQPLEPKAMDPREIQRRWPGTFCLLGNIDLDLLARGTPDAVAAHVRDRVDTLNGHGGYMPGVSNTVPTYVRTANYLRMIQTVYSYPDEQVF
ncbi:hypothetical protein HQ590_15200 [bacterium]|nr:hypothetical protein [bacterium]